MLRLNIFNFIDERCQHGESVGDAVGEVHLVVFILESILPRHRVAGVLVRESF